MAKILNALFLILLVQLVFIESVRKSSITKTKTQAYSVSDFTEIVEYWKALFKRVHELSDKIFDSISGDSDTISQEALDEVWEGTFEQANKKSDKIPQELLDFWFVEDEDKTDELDSSNAYIATQNAVVLAVLDNLYSGSTFKAQGQFKEEIESLVNDITAAHLRFDQISKNWFKQADTSGDEQIDLEEFKTTFSQLLDQEDDVEKVFAEVDKDGSGYLDQQEVTHVLGKLLLRHNPYFIINSHQESAVGHEEVHDHVDKPVELGTSFLEKN
jgi:Ca2+-binding EF-hand superfamily protein